MPLDSRRLPVPEGTVSPQLFLPKPSRERLVKRKDRKPEEPRPVFLRVGVNCNAKGSAYLEMGKTKIMCSLYGPRESAKHQDYSVKGQLFCQFKFAPFSCRQRRQHMQDQQEKELSAFLKETLEPAICLNKFPKSIIDVFVLVLENDGSATAGAITCAGAAIADAGIDMYDIVVGSSFRQCGDQSLVDPSCDEEFNTMDNIDNQYEDNGNMTLGFLPTFQQVAAVTQNGSMKPETISKGLKLLIENCRSLGGTVQQCLLDSLKHGDKKIKIKDLPPAS